MSIRQRRTLIAIATTVAAVAALLLGIATGDALGDNDRAASSTTTTGRPITSDRLDGSGGTDTGATTDETTTTIAPTTTAPAPGSEPEPEPTSDPEPEPTSDPEPEPASEPADHPIADCDGDHDQGEWTVEGPGESVAVNELVPFGGECAGVIATLDEPASGVRVQRRSAFNTTFVWFEGAGPEPGPIGDDFIDFDTVDDRIGRAFVFRDAGGIGVILYHPSSVSADLGARVDLDGEVATISIREQVPGDPRRDDTSGDAPHLTPRGPFWDGLVVDQIAPSVASDSVLVRGYAKAPEGHIEFDVFDTSDGTAVCSSSGMAAGPMWLFSKYSFGCDPGGPGTYDVVIGWPSMSDDPADAVWYVEEVSVD